MKWIGILLGWMLAYSVVAATPSDTSLKELLEVTDARKGLDTSLEQTEHMMHSVMAKSLEGKPVTPAQQEAINRMQSKVLAVLKEEMNWTKFEPVLVDIYRQSLTQEEVDGALNFYRSDVGRSMTQKMPLIMQNSMQAVQNLMLSMMPRLAKIQEELQAELKATQAQ